MNKQTKTCMVRMGKETLEVLITTVGPKEDQVPVMCTINEAVYVTTGDARTNIAIGHIVVVMGNGLGDYIEVSKDCTAIVRVQNED